MEVTDAGSSAIPLTEEEHQDGLPEKIGAMLGGAVFVIAWPMAHILARPSGRVTALADAMN